MEGEGKSVRTQFHGRHFPDLPGGEITIEGSIVKHCTRSSNKEKSKIKKMGWEKKEERALFKNRISAATENKEEKGNRSSQKKDLILERGGRMYVLYAMVVTFPTCHVERLPLKAPAPLNTAPQQQRKVQR